MELLSEIIPEAGRNITKIEGKETLDESRYKFRSDSDESAEIKEKRGEESSYSSDEIAGRTSYADKIFIQKIAMISPSNPKRGEQSGEYDAYTGVLHSETKNTDVDLDSPKPKLDDSTTIFSEKGAEEAEKAGSSGKRKTSDEEVRVHPKRRRFSLWTDDCKLKMLGPIHLPDFKNEQCPLPESGIGDLKEKLISINCKLQRPELLDDRPLAERSPSPEPVYDEHEVRINTRESRLRNKLEEERQGIISSLIRMNPTFKQRSNYMPEKFCKKLYIPVREYPGYNFIGPIIGPRGNTQKRMQKETGARIQIRGKGASRTGSESENANSEDLHVYIEADNEESLESAVTMVEKLLIPFDSGLNEHRLSQMQELAQLSRSNEQEAKKEDNEASLYIGNLPCNLDENSLKNLFLPFGNIVSVRVIRDRATGFSKGYGFVNFENSDEAAMAVTVMQGSTLSGKMLIVRIAGRSSSSTPPLKHKPEATRSQPTCSYPAAPAIGYPAAMGYPVPTGYHISPPPLPYFPAYYPGYPYRPFGPSYQPPYQGSSCQMDRSNYLHLPSPARLFWSPELKLKISPSPWQQQPPEQLEN